MYRPFGTGMNCKRVVAREYITRERAQIGSRRRRVKSKSKETLLFFSVLGVSDLFIYVLDLINFAPNKRDRFGAHGACAMRVRRRSSSLVSLMKTERERMWTHVYISECTATSSIIFVYSLYYYYIIVSYFTLHTFSTLSHV